jgi:hypothetical protein
VQGMCVGDKGSKEGNRERERDGGREKARERVWVYGERRGV